jgi:hypothetical protein
MWNVIAPMVAGFAVDKMMGGNGVQGAIGGATMGYGSGATAAGGKGAMAGNTAATGLNAGTALGSGGMNTIQGMNALGMGSAVNAGLGGLTTSVPETAGGYSDLLGGDSMLQNYDMGMGEALGNPNLGLNVDNAILNPITNMPVAPDMSQTNMLPALEGYQPSNIPTTPDFTSIAGAEQGTGGYEQSGMFDNGLLNYLGDFVPTKKDLGGMAINMGVNALTPEQEERIRHQQAMVSRGQTGSLLGQGGYQGIGGPYISRAGS